MELCKIKGETVRQRHGKKQLGIVVKLYTSLSPADSVTKQNPSQHIPFPGGNLNHIWNVAVDTLMHYRMVQNESSPPACDSGGSGIKCRLQAWLRCFYFF